MSYSYLSWVITRCVGIIGSNYVKDSFMVCFDDRLFCTSQNTEQVMFFLTVLVLT